MAPVDDPVNFPIGLIVLLLASAGVGLVLVFAGNRVVLAGLGLVGAIVGLILGWIGFEILLPDAPAWVGAVALGTLLSILLALSSKLMLASLLAIVLGAAGWMTVSSADRHGLFDFERPPAVALVDEHEPTAKRDAERTEAEGVESTFRGAVEDRLMHLALSFRAPQLQRQLATTTEHLRSAIDAARDQWRETPAALRTLMLASAGMCAFLGLCLGLVAPRLTASGLTAAFGAALIVLCALVTLEQFATTDAPSTPTPGLWLGGWSLLTMTGVVVQTMRKPRSASKPVEE